MSFLYSKHLNFLFWRFAFRCKYKRLWESFSFAFRLLLIILLFSEVEGQKRFAVVLVPEQQFDSKSVGTKVSTFEEKIVSKFEEVFQLHFRVIDSSLAKSAFKAQGFQSPLNLSIVEARNLGNAIGCDFYALVKAEVLLRTSLEKGTYYEAYSALFFVSTATGRLFFWNLTRAEAESPKLAEEKFFSAFNDFLTKALTEIQLVLDKDIKVQDAMGFPEIPSENSPEAKDFRPPIPYRRIKPEYPSLASLYVVTATIDIAVDIDEQGRIVGTEILRWAGYGLEESVINAVKAMNWRPAERKGKPTPVRVLLRYNFKKGGEEK
ncbi:MAG: hypothetical protein KatS3mg006_0487 [Pyrinomonadaceae bacterium]|nr:MAG: hypothetical protein KatS3mg006_0487 [Pyrinomonadaceae bacterium]